VIPAGSRIYHILNETYKIEEMKVIERKIRGLVRRRLLPRSVQRMIWNREYATGQWDSRSLHTPDDPIYELLAEYCVDRDICDIGSGHGNTITEMPLIYRTYTGVDISDVALGIAAKRAAEAGRERVAFIQGFMHTFTPKKKPSVFLFRESLYYVSRRRSRLATNMASFLRRYAAMLAPDGIMICRLCISTPSEEWYAAQVETVVCQNFKVIECRRTQEPPALLLVFKPSRRMDV
jgi:2-polyprenyl-3-methyl-5-hydroxy-6-metoxy-1,4-benzoquinol methylase